MLQGTFILNNSEYKFEISDYKIQFYAESNNYLYWDKKRKSKDFLFTQPLHGVDENNRSIYIQPSLILAMETSLPPSQRTKIILTLDYVILWYDTNNDCRSTNGISISFPSSVQSSCQKHPIPKRNDCLGSWFYNCTKRSFIWKCVNNLPEPDIIKKVYLLIDTLRFICQSNIIGNVKIELLYNGKNVGCIQYCKKIDIYCKGQMSQTLEDVLCIISQQQFNKIIEQAENNSIYMSHIVDTAVPPTVTPGWFITVVAGFEWECCRFNFKMEHSAQSIQEQKKVIDYLDKEIENSSKHAKKHYKNYKKAIKEYDEQVNLMEKIKRIFYKDEFQTYWEVLIPAAYEIYKDKKDLDKIASRLTKQRNDFAHGNWNKEIDPICVIDIFLLRKAMFILQLDRCNIEEYTIKIWYDLIFRNEHPFSKNDMLNDALKALDVYIDEMKAK